MEEIQSTEVTPALRALFDANGPAALRCFALLDGKTAGRILTDDARDPSWAAAWEAYEDGTTFLGGRLDAGVVSEVVENLRSKGDVLIGFWPGDPAAALLPDEAEYDGWVLEWTGRDPRVTLEPYRRHLPPGWQIRPVDGGLLLRTAWGEGIIQQFGSVEGYLGFGLGYCLMDGDIIVSEAWVGPISGGVREISVETHEPYRRKGYGAIVCAHAIQVCEAAGYQTYWNTARQNVASAGLARKLGYGEPKEYRLLAWFRQPLAPAMDAV
jgi:GNAT superfamily N-acetyltransferase